LVKVQNRTEIDTHDGGVFIEDEERVKEEFVENWLEQQNEVDDVPPPPSVHSEIEYEDEHQVPPHAQDQNEYEADRFHGMAQFNIDSHFPNTTLVLRFQRGGTART
jgi:hypothetical protein